ncbi:hypothetical protein AM420_005704, partial [Klebsiella pneumoniae]
MRVCSPVKYHCWCYKICSQIHENKQEHPLKMCGFMS